MKSDSEKAMKTAPSHGPNTAGRDHTGQKAPPMKENSFASFWAKFETAVANKNKETIAAMTKFPFEYFGRT